jgi:uncharacterized cupredoxin-like copper-binding protein
VAASLALAIPATSAVAKSKGGKPVAVQLFEFGVKRKPKFVAAGKVTFTAKNIGTMKHEMVVVRVQPGAKLPTKADGSIDEEAIPETDKMGEVGTIKPKKSGKLTKTLDPGSYVLFCNLVNTQSGTTFVHYERGMHATFTAG